MTAALVPLLTLLAVGAETRWSPAVAEALAVGVGEACAEKWSAQLPPESAPTISVQLFSNQTGVEGIDLLWLSRRVKAQVGRTGLFRTLPPAENGEWAVQGVLQREGEDFVLKVRLIDPKTNKHLGGCQQKGRGAPPGTEPQAEEKKKVDDRAQKQAPSPSAGDALGSLPDGWSETDVSYDNLVRYDSKEGAHEAEKQNLWRAFFNRTHGQRASAKASLQKLGGKPAAAKTFQPTQLLFDRLAREEKKGKTPPADMAAKWAAFLELTKPQLVRATERLGLKMPID